MMLTAATDPSGSTGTLAHWLQGFALDAALPRANVIEKFHALTAGLKERSRADRIIARVMNIEALGDVSELQAELASDVGRAFE